MKKRRMTRTEFAAKMSLLSGSLSLDGFDGCDVTIEAVLEKLAVKQAVLKEWEAVARPDAIFASNTSTLPDHRDREGGVPPRAGRRDALLQPGPQDAARRGDLRREDGARGDGDDLRAGEEDGEDAGRREGRPGLPGQPDPRPLPR